MNKGPHRKPEQDCKQRGKEGGMRRGEVFVRLGFLGGLFVLRPALDHCAM